MKILLIILMALSLSSCQEAQDFMYENFSLQKNIDKADENSRKNIEGDFKLDDFGYTFPPNVGRFVQNGFDYNAAINGEAQKENLETIPAGKSADIFLTKDDNQIFVKATNNSSTEINIIDAPINYIEISNFDLASMDFALGDIKFGDALYDIEAKVPDKEIIELRQNTKDTQNDQYYMYLNGKYVVIFTMYQGKLAELEIIPNESLSSYE
ncbi:hypothetical protein [uncultured Anaerococcus sp.]|uniref:hypothetical protein n=1 Tax=Anaerococcus sp. AH8042_DFU013_CI05 TaxID=3385202 RepID=UPI0025FDE768|nr:hypothetical protein [uncultured Anaerococcus sp.]